MLATLYLKLSHDSADADPKPFPVREVAAGGKNLVLVTKLCIRSTLLQEGRRKTCKTGSSLRVDLAAEHQSSSHASR